MAMKSPSHQFATTNPEPLSSSDATPYAAICVIARSGNAAGLRFGGDDITSSGGGKSLDAGDAFWIAIPQPGVPVYLTEIFAVGSVGDVVDTICKRY